MLTSHIRFVAAVLLVFSPMAAQARGGGGSLTNPGTTDINRTIDPQAAVTQVGSTAVTGVMTTGPLQPNAGANGLTLPATTTGAIPASAGTAVLGATGRDMDECMAAWDVKTHVTKARWYQICAATLSDLQS
jgi:hypothetical protein